MKICKHVVFATLLFSFKISSSNAQPPGTHLYFGLLHAHTLFSDGSGTPEEAYQKAKDAGLNFFAITEHNHAAAESGAAERRDGILIANNHDLYNGNNTITITPNINGSPQTMHVKSLKKAAADATTSTFLAMYGQEFSSISSGNHVNVFNAPEVLTIPNGNFKELYDWVQSTNDNNIIIQMNHPDVHGDMFNQGANNNDYGIDEPLMGNGFTEFVSKADRYIQLIEILSGPAMNDFASPNFHYAHTHENDYFFYLKQGFHLAPSAGQDNHYKTWGVSSSARIGVYATGLTNEAICEAFRTYRTFATEDKNLSIVFSINGSVMGSNISAASDQPLNMEIKVTDSDDPSPVYTIEVYGGAIEPKSYAQAQKLNADDGKMDAVTLNGNGTASFNSISSGDPQFFYVLVIEGDGDRAWSAPVWVNAPEGGVSQTPDSGAVTFYWTKNPSSQVYHAEGCSSIKTISPTNLMSG
ncbi:MAG: CehA/McbA family metallohydrolase, partial [Bacteroidota bacterium]